MKNDAITPTPCEYCGGPMPTIKLSGMPPKTCSRECQKKRAAQRERERYQRVKGSEQWKSVRAAYVEALKKKADQDPGFAEKRRLYHLKVLARSRKRLALDPERLAAYKEKTRQWWANLPQEKREDYKERNRAWYASLTPEEKRIHFYERRRQRALESLAALGDDAKLAGDGE